MSTFDKGLTTAGIALCLISWAGLLSGSLVETGALTLAGRAVSQRDLMILAQSTLMTGSALIFLACMRNGFGALDRFFEAALDRASRAQARVEESDAGAAALRGSDGSLITPSASGVTLEGRSCTRLGDGSIVIETLLGLRRFRSEAEARQFIGILPPSSEADVPRSLAHRA